MTYEFIFAENQTQLDLAPTIFTFDTAELLRSHKWPADPLGEKTEALVAERLAAEICKRFGRRTAYRVLGSKKTPWTLTTVPQAPSRKRLDKMQLDALPSNEIYDLMLARGNDCAFAELSVIGTMDVGAYKRYGYSDGPSTGMTAKHCAITLLELFECGIAYRPTASRNSWFIASEPEYFTPFDDETMRIMERQAGGGLYRLHVRTAA